MVVIVVELLRPAKVGRTRVPAALRLHAFGAAQVQGGPERILQLNSCSRSHLEASCCSCKLAQNPRSVGRSPCMAGCVLCKRRKTDSRPAGCPRPAARAWSLDDRAATTSPHWTHCTIVRDKVSKAILWGWQKLWGTNSVCWKWVHNRTDDNRSPS